MYLKIVQTIILPIATCAYENETMKIKLIHSKCCIRGGLVGYREITRDDLMQSMKCQSGVCKSVRGSFQEDPAGYSGDNAGFVSPLL